MRAFKYLHIFIGADESKESYPSKLVEEQLNKLGQEGWELVNMTPDWESTYDYAPTFPYSVDVPAAYSLPDYIAGWYCTFKRSLA